jgi:AcrR family transcriptional regulator
MTDDSRSARQKILDVASKRFCRDGFRAVGVDTIIAESGVAKMTLYRHFPSKDDLIVAYLEDANRKFWEWFEASLGPGSAQEQLRSLFDALKELVTSATCLGCSFQHAAADFPDPQHPGHRVALAHKQAVHVRLHDLTMAMDARDPEALAAQLLLLIDGAFVAIRMYGPQNPGAYVAQAASALIDAQVSTKDEVLREQGTGNREQE